MTENIKNENQVEYYDNGQKKLEVRYIHGMKDGVQTEWYESGIKKSKLTFIQGKENGDEFGWHENGVMAYKGCLVNDSAEGLGTYWHDNGNKSEEGYHKNNDRDGIWTFWYEDGTKKSEIEYKHDKKDGVIRAWHKNGSRKAVGNYQDGIANGKWVFYDVSGNISSEGEYLNGSQNGVWNYYNNGNKSSKGSFSNGEKDGLWSYFDKEGNTYSQGNFENGKFLYFSGFAITNQALQKSIDSMNYEDEDTVSKILGQYSEALQGLITGMASPAHAKEINILASHMAGAASKGDFRGVAISCFCNQGDDFDKYLPVPINQMNAQAGQYFASLVQAFGGIGFSKSGKKYLLNNKRNIELMANNNYHAMQYLMGYLYSFDDVDTIGREKCIHNRRAWYERSALGGYRAAYFETGTLFDGDNGDVDRDLGKAAYWYYKGCKNEDIQSCYNLGIMYAMGDFLEKDLDASSFYLSLVYRNARKYPKFSHYEQDAKSYLDNNSIALQSPPYIHGDKEQDPAVAELFNVYPKKYTDKQKESISDLKKLIRKVAIKLKKDESSFTKEAATIMEIVYSKLNYIYLSDEVYTLCDIDNETINKWQAFATLAISSVFTLHARKLKHGVASLMGGSSFEIGDIFSYVFDGEDINDKDCETLGDIIQTMVIGADSTIKSGGGMFSSLTGGKYFEGTWNTPERAKSNFSLSNNYIYVGVSYLTFGLPSENKMFEQFDDEGKGILMRELNKVWFIISKITPMPDSYFTSEEEKK